MRASRFLRIEVEDTIAKYPNLLRFKLGTVVVPEELRAGLTKCLKGYPRASLTQNAKVLAEVLRRRTRGRPSEASAGLVKPRVLLHYDTDEVLTYLAHRVPGIYATAFRVLREVQFKLPHFRPESMIDFGSGPGTMIRACKVVWPSVMNAAAIEPSEAMQKVSEKLLLDMKTGIEIDRRRHLVDKVEKQCDVVAASYSLGELQDVKEREQTVKLLWSLVRDGGVMILIEPGTPIGFKTIKDARETLLKGGGTPVAPCPHAQSCPMPSTSWCHFKQRIRKTPLQMQTKLNKSVNFSDEKFSYLVVSKNSPPLRTPADSSKHRVLWQPLKKGGHVVLQTCSDKGKFDQIIVAKSHGADVYRSARKAFAGDDLIVPNREKKEPKVVVVEPPVVQKKENLVVKVKKSVSKKQ